MSNKSTNKRTLTQIAKDKDPVALYITEKSISITDYDNNKEGYQLNLGGLLITDGDIDDTYNWATTVYLDGSRWDGLNACTDDVREVLNPLVDDLIDNDEFVKRWFTDKDLWDKKEDDE